MANKQQNPLGGKEKIGVEQEKKGKGTDKEMSVPVKVQKKSSSAPMMAVKKGQEPKMEKPLHSPTGHPAVTEKKKVVKEVEKIVKKKEMKKTKKKEKVEEKKEESMEIDEMEEKEVEKGSEGKEGEEEEEEGVALFKKEEEKEEEKEKEKEKVEEYKPIASFDELPIYPFLKVTISSS